MTAPPRRYLPHILLIAITAFTFAPLLRADFTSWDDYSTVARNWRMRPATLENMLYYWRHPAMDLYVPVTYSAWSAIAMIAERGDAGATLNPAVFHAANILIHLATVLAMYGLIRRLIGASDWAAFFGAAIFAIHPMQVETVAWVSGLKDLLCGLFCVMALAWYAASAGSRRNFAIATACFIIAMLCKPTAMVLPLAAVAVDLFFLHEVPGKAYVRWLIWLGVAIPCVIWTRHFQPAAPFVAPSIVERPLVAADALAFYTGKLVAPIRLCVDYGRMPSRVLAGAACYIWMILAAISIGLVWRRRRSPLAGAAVLFLIPLLPVLGLVPFDFQTYSTVADHYVYLPMVGVGVAVAWLCRYRLARMLAGVGIIAFVPLSILQTQYWRDSEALFNHVLAVNPLSFAAQNSLAAAAIERNDLTAAEAHARAALAVAPNDVTARVHLAAALARTNRKAQALALLREAIAIDPESAPANINLGGLLADLGDPSAEAQLRRAVAIAPDDPSPYQNLGTLLASQNRLDEAGRDLAIAMRLSPGDARIRTNYAIVLAAEGHSAEAAEELRVALQIDPDFSPARQALSDLGGRASP